MLGANPGGTRLEGKARRLLGSSRVTGRCDAGQLGGLGSPPPLLGGHASGACPFSSVNQLFPQGKRRRQSTAGHKYPDPVPV